MKDLKKGELQNVLDSKEPVVIFYYMETCPHCKVMHKPWNELEKEEPNTKFVKIESAEIPSDMGISGFPHFQKRKGKKVEKEVGGEMTKEDLKKKLFGGFGGKRTRRRRARRLTRRGRKVRK
jgi:thiol-disulfide isomerase/thioredoxin